MEITTAQEAISDIQELVPIEAAALGHSNTDLILTNSVLCAKKLNKSTNQNEWTKVKVQQEKDKGLAQVNTFPQAQVEKLLKRKIQYLKEIYAVRNANCISN